MQYNMAATPVKGTAAAQQNVLACLATGSNHQWPFVGHNQPSGHHLYANLQNLWHDKEGVTRLETTCLEAPES